MGQTMYKIEVVALYLNKTNKRNALKFAMRCYSNKYSFIVIKFVE